MMTVPCPYCDYQGRRSEVHAHLAEAHASEISWGVQERTGHTYATISCPLCGARWEQVLRKARRDPSFVDEFRFEISLVVFDLLLHHLRGEYGIGE